MAINTGAKVKIHYKLTVDGQVIDSSDGQEPLTYTHGSSQIIPGLETHVANMNKGDKSSVTVEPELGYGERNPQAIQKVPKTNFQDADKMQVGGIVTGTAGDQQFQAVIAEITDTEVVLDMNHPLAGKTLNFEIELVDVEPGLVQ